MRNTLNTSENEPPTPSTEPLTEPRAYQDDNQRQANGNRKRYPPRARRPAKLSEWVARDILQLIVKDNLLPGAKIAGEQETVAQFGVSRATVREAFRLLEDHGLITVKMGPGGGPCVAEITPAKFGRTASFFFEALGSSLEEIAEFRLAIDPVMVALAAKNQWPTGMALIRTFVEEEDSPDDSGSEWLQTTNAFHHALVSATGNRAMDLMAGAMHLMYCDRTELEGTYEDADRLPAGAHHRSIGEAVLLGDVERARAEMKAHSEYVYRYAIERYPHLLHQTIQWG
jgi:GntR family transcriptional repressor for pyruvate dehydrogenase complex